MSVSDINETDETPLAIQTLLLVGARSHPGADVLLVYLSLPGWQAARFLGICVFWLREILIVASAALLMLVVLVGWCVRLVKRIFLRN